MVFLLSILSCQHFSSMRSINTCQAYVVQPFHVTRKRELDVKYSGTFVASKINFAKLEAVQRVSWLFDLSA